MNILSVAVCLLAAGFASAKQKKATLRTSHAAQVQATDNYLATDYCDVTSCVAVSGMCSMVLMHIANEDMPALSACFDSEIACNGCMESYDEVEGVEDVCSMIIEEKDLGFLERPSDGMDEVEVVTGCDVELCALVDDGAFCAMIKMHWEAVPPDMTAFADCFEAEEQCNGCLASQIDAVMAECA